jgi:transposase, IS6 family
VPITPTNAFEGRQYPGDVIVTAVRWYLRYPLAYEHRAELLAERELTLDRSCVWQWGQACALEISKRCRPYLKLVNKSYRVDETSIKVKGHEKSLYRAVDSSGPTIEGLLPAQRDREAAKRFFRTVFSTLSNPVPRVINVDQNAADPAAVKALKREGILPRRVRLRQCKYLNNVIEQDHRNSKKRLWLAKGYQTFPSARRTREGLEALPMIRKGRVRGVAKKDVVAEARFVAKLFDLAAELPLSCFIKLVSVCMPLQLRNKTREISNRILISGKSGSSRCRAQGPWPENQCPWRRDLSNSKDPALEQVRSDSGRSNGRTFPVLSRRG